MRRREFLVTLAGAGLARPFSARAQVRVRRVGVLIPYAHTDARSAVELAAFRDVLRQHGWREGENLVIDTRWGEGDVGRLAPLAAELVRTHPDVVLVRTTGATQALLRQTRDIPIVFVMVSDPVGDGFVTSMAHPGGNATGFTNVEASVAGKWLELLREVSPRLDRVGLVFGPQVAAGGGSYYGRLVQAAAAPSGIEVVSLGIRDPGDIRTAMGDFSRRGPGGFIVLPDSVTSSYRRPIIEAATASRLPAIYAIPEFVHEGGLMAYGIDITDVYRRAGTYVDRILNGAAASDLPVQAPVRFELVLNVKVAATLDIAIPPSLLARADEVIE